jgi:hypothetical protein
MNGNRRFYAKALCPVNIFLLLLVLMLALRTTDRTGEENDEAQMTNDEVKLGRVPIPRERRCIPANRRAQE